LDSQGRLSNRRDEIALMDIRRDALAQSLDKDQTLAVIESSVPDRLNSPSTSYLNSGEMVTKRHAPLMPRL
jgi:hypothetical protein